MDNKNEFKPYIPADKIVPEFTVTSIVIGIILAVVFGAANAYLGLLVGMTISASIPAVLPVSLWQQVRSLHCRLCSSGQRKARSSSRAL